MEFGVLGSLEATQSGALVPLGSATKPRLLLAALLSRADSAVTLGWLTSVLWADRPPVSARQNLQHYVHQLRSILGRDCIYTHPGGYLIRVGDRLDAVRFRRLAAEGGAALHKGDGKTAAERLRLALDLWRGPAYADFADVTPIGAEAARLEELRLGTYENWAEAELSLGRYGVPIADLMDLSTAHPYRESLISCLMRALYGGGRQADALELFRSTRATLVDQLGIEPGAELRGLHEQMLRGDCQSASWATNASVSAKGPANATPVPRELPADVSNFVGRTSDLKALDESLSDDAGVVVTCVITGTAGVGKTALAVHWAHRVVDHFPDGQLYIDLRGHSADRPIHPTQALASVVARLGLPPERVPVDLVGLQATFRSLTADRRLLIVVDNARSAAQVRPLMPSGRGSAMLVTSRDRLIGLIAREGARRIALDVLSADDSIGLLRRVLGPERVVLEPRATAELAAACSYLPLVLRIAAADLADSPDTPISAYVRKLKGDHFTELAANGDDVAVWAAFDLSYRTLPEPARRTFRQIGFAPCVDVGAPAAAVLTAMDEQQARQALETLAAAHLVVEHNPGRFLLHDLLQQFARTLSAKEDSEAVRTAAVQRLFNWFVSMSTTAADLLYPEVLRLPLGEDQTTTPALTDAAEARQWLDAERHNLVAGILYAARCGPREAAWRCADALRAYHDQGRYISDWVATSRAAVAAARSDNNPHAMAASYQGLAHAHYALTNYRRSVTYLQRALALARTAKWHEAEATILSNVAIALDTHGNTAEAAEHLRLALEMHDRINWSSGRARATLNLATIYQRLGRLRESADLASKAADIYPSDATLGQAHAAGTLGEAYALLGRLAEATNLLNTALTTYRTFGSLRSEASCQVWRVRVHCEAGRLDQAGQAASSAVKLAAETKLPELVAVARHCQGLVREASGDYIGAARSYEIALATARKIDAPYPTVEALLGIARSWHNVGDHVAATEYATEALSLAQNSGYAVLTGQSLTVLAALSRHLGDGGQALSLARQALVSHEHTGHRIGEADTRLLLASILWDLGDHPTASEYVKTATSLYERAGAPLPLLSTKSPPAPEVRSPPVRGQGPDDME